MIADTFSQGRFVDFFQEYNLYVISSNRDHHTLDWSTDICAVVPMVILAPFSFTISSGGSTSVPIYCGWAVGNTVFRCVVSILCLLTMIGEFSGILSIIVFRISPYVGLFFPQTDFHKLGRTLICCSGISYFAVTIVDLYSLANGEVICNRSFGNTFIDFKGANQEITCE